MAAVPVDRLLVSLANPGIAGNATQSPDVSDCQMLLRRLLFIAFLLSLAAAALALWSVDRVRARDRALAVEWMAASFQTDLIRARCEANPKWFLAGPREDAPSAALLADPDADVLAPRPDA